MKLSRIFGAALALLFALPVQATEQSSYVTPTAGPMPFATFVGTYLNPALRALAGCHNGASAPVNGPSSLPLAYQCWWDTTSNPSILKIYDGTSWVSAGPRLNTSTHAMTQVLGVTTATTLNGNTFTTGTYTLTGTAGKTLNFTNSLTFGGTDGTTLTFQNSDVIVSRSSTDTLTNKTLDTAGTGNSFSINGLAATANTGTGAVVRAASPTLTTPALGTPSALVLTNATGLPLGSVTGLGTGVGTFLGTPTSANLLAAVTDETGTGSLVFHTNPTINAAVAAGTWTASGTWTVPALTLGGTVSGGGNQINNVIIGTSTPLAGSFTTLGSGAHTVTSASATALAVGLNGATNPAFAIDASSASQAAGLKVTGAATGGTVAVAAIDSGTNTNLTINAKGSGTIGIGSVSTGAVTITPAVTLSNALTYGGVTFTNTTTGSGSLVAHTNPTLNAAVGAGTWTASGTWTLPAVTLGGAITYGGVTLSNAVTGTGNMVLATAPTFGSTVNAVTGYKVNGAATSGQYLRGNGTNFVDAAIAAGDLPLASSAAFGAVKVDNTTITASGGVITAVGAAATAITVGTTTVGSSTTGHLLYNNGGTLGGQAIASALTAGTGVAITGTTNATIGTNLSTLTNSLGADVALSNVGLYFDGPSVAQGTSGKWCAMGTVTTVQTGAAGGNMFAKLWDGTTVIASSSFTTANGFTTSFSLSGCITSPAGNIRISVQSQNTTTGANILFNFSGNSKDSTITVFRVN